VWPLIKEQVYNREIGKKTEFMGEYLMVSPFFFFTGKRRYSLWMNCLSKITYNETLFDIALFEKFISKSYVCRQIQQLQQTLYQIFIEIKQIIILSGVKGEKIVLIVFKIG
jgi:hypothetical protein